YLFLFSPDTATTDIYTLSLHDALPILNSRLDTMAYTDELTGLANRRRFYEALREEWSRSTRHKRPLSIILLDFDHFKQINDNHGHQTGDKVLASGAAMIRKMTR